MTTFVKCDVCGSDMPGCGARIISEGRHVGNLFRDTERFGGRIRVTTTVELPDCEDKPDICKSCVREIAKSGGAL